MRSTGDKALPPGVYAIGELLPRVLARLGYPQTSDQRRETLAAMSPEDGGLDYEPSACLDSLPCAVV